MARICRQFTAGADQQHVHRLTQTSELALIVEDDGLDPGALGNEPQQPRLAAARIGLNEKSGIDQRREVKLQLLAADDLTDDYRRFRANPSITTPTCPTSTDLSEKAPPEGKRSRGDSALAPQLPASNKTDAAVSQTNGTIAEPGTD